MCLILQQPCPAPVQWNAAIPENAVSTTLFTAHLPGLELLHSGKVRDVFVIDDDHLLIVASDRLSAYDVILPDPIPGKGEMLTQISNFWFARTAALLPNHLTGVPIESVLPQGVDNALYRHRAVVVKRLRALPVEAIVRGYLIGSGWRDYQRSGHLCGLELPPGLQMAAQLPDPVFTPSTKAQAGEHDENISFAAVEKLIGSDMAAQVRNASLAVYAHAVEYAAARGIIIADTKLEFGLDRDGKLHVMDEMLTPDSSRFWPADSYQPGTSPASYDKQYVRDYLDTLDWNKQAPAPALPADIIEGTRRRYAQALEILTG